MEEHWCINISTIIGEAFDSLPLTFILVEIIGDHSDADSWLTLCGPPSGIEEIIEVVLFFLILRIRDEETPEIVLFTLLEAALNDSVDTRAILVDDDPGEPTDQVFDGEFSLASIDASKAADWGALGSHRLDQSELILLIVGQVLRQDPDVDVLLTIGVLAVSNVFDEEKVLEVRVQYLLSQWGVDHSQPIPNVLGNKATRIRR